LRENGSKLEMRTMTNRNEISSNSPSGDAQQHDRLAQPELARDSVDDRGDTFNLTAAEREAIAYENGYAAAQKATQPNYSQQPAVETQTETQPGRDSGSGGLIGILMIALSVLILTMLYLTPKQPAVAPTEPQVQPTAQPPIQPTVQPTVQQVQPQAQPQVQPTAQPQMQPTAQPVQPAPAPSVVQPQVQPQIQPQSPALQPSTQPQVVQPAQPQTAPVDPALVQPAAPYPNQTGTPIPSSPLQ
jgi:hypothetical protein